MNYFQRLLLYGLIAFIICCIVIMCIYTLLFKLNILPHMIKYKTLLILALYLISIGFYVALFFIIHGIIFGKIKKYTNKNNFTKSLINKFEPFVYLSIFGSIFVLILNNGNPVNTIQQFLIYMLHVAIVLLIVFFIIFFYNFIILFAIE